MNLQEIKIKIVNVSIDHVEYFLVKYFHENCFNREF